jgi:hypothetical protein
VKRILLLGLLVISLSGVANATTMDQIIANGGTIQIGDKVFGDFSVAGTGSARIHN